MNAVTSFLDVIVCHNITRQHLNFVHDVIFIMLDYSYNRIIHKYCAKYH